MDFLVCSYSIAADYINACLSFTWLSWVQGHSMDQYSYETPAQFFFFLLNRRSDMHICWSVYGSVYIYESQIWVTLCKLFIWSSEKEAIRALSKHPYTALINNDKVQHLVIL